jgi:hypothetical protein
MTTKTKIIVFTSLTAILVIAGYFGVRYLKNKKPKHSNIDKAGNLIDPSKDMDGNPVIKYTPPAATNTPIPTTVIPPSNSIIGKPVFAKYDGVKVYRILADGTPNINNVYKTAKKGDYIMQVMVEKSGWFNDGVVAVGKTNVSTSN